MSIITVTQCLTLANEVLQQYTNLSSINFICAHLMEYNNLVFDISLATRDTYYKPYFLTLQQTIGNHIAFNQIDGETRWFKFIFHCICLDTLIDYISNSLHNYPELTLPQTPCWLITDETKYTIKKDSTSKTASVVEMSLLGNHYL